LFQDEVFSASTQQIANPQQPRPNKTDVQTGVQNGEALQRLKRHLEETKPYLNETLTLTELAAQLGITRNQLSSLINSTTGENFYTFINKYRIEEVKRLIANPKNMNFTILSLAHEAGFSSKSAFQAVFKKFTGLTPSEYRNTLR
jgi:AraC-like DNA-binding protein